MLMADVCSAYGMLDLWKQADEEHLLLALSLPVRKLSDSAIDSGYLSFASDPWLAE
jgi:hypothetical protein